MNISVLVAAHKEVDFPKDELYVPIQVNACNSEHFLEVTDDTGDNISCLNDRYSELTALYYAWKNMDYDYIGLAHYRRYLALKPGGSINKVLTKTQAEQLLKEYKLLLPRKRNYYIETLYSHYAHTFDGSHLDRVKKIIAEQCSEYLSSFEYAMSRKTGYMFNMFITSKELVNEYCAWLFPILFELDKIIDAESMTDFEKRYSGRISERLFNVWFDHQLKTGRLTEKDIKELPYVYIGKEPWGRKIVSFLGAKFLGKKYRKSF